jgi:zinc protease
MVRQFKSCLRLGGIAVAFTLVSAPLATAQTTWPSERPPAPRLSKAVDFPPYQIKTLKNGLQVLVVDHHEQPSVSFRLMIKAGAMQEPADRPGVAAMVATLINQGTTTRSAGDIANLIESAGGVMGVGSGNELTHVNGAVIKDRTELALELAADVVKNPAFSPGEIDRHRPQVMNAIKVNYEDPDYIANAVFDRIVFGAHPYGRSATPESIARITRDDLVRFHRTWFVPNNALLAIVGDLTADEAFAAAEKAFGTWERREVPAVNAIDPPAMARRVIVIDRPNSPQTEIRIGHLGLPRTHKDHLPLDLTVRILGGEGANRLFGVLRTDRGLTYGASASNNSFRAAGDIRAETDTRTEATGQALRLMVDEFFRLQREPVHPAELRGAQDFVAGNFPLTIESPSAIAQQVLAHMFFGLQLSEIETYRERVERITPDDIQRAAKEYLKPEQLVIVLVGDAAKFEAQLKATGFAQFERIPLAQLDLNSPTLRRGAPAAGNAVR